MGTNGGWMIEVQREGQSAAIRTAQDPGDLLAWLSGYLSGDPALVRFNVRRDYSGGGLYELVGGEYL